MITEMLASIILVALWMMSFWFTLNIRSRLCAYGIALALAILIVWNEAQLLAPAGTVEQLISSSIFVASLTIASTSDLFDMLIPRFCSLWLIPFWILFAWLNLTPLSPHDALLGALLGYGILWIIDLLFKLVTKKQGMGDGDKEFLAMIGSFVGPCSVITSLYIGTLTALIIGLPYLYFIKKNMQGRLPFAPALAFGALISFRVCLL